MTLPAAATVHYPSDEPIGRLRRARPCVMVIIGGAGDLTQRKLIPSLYHLEVDGALPPTFTVLCVGREAFPDIEFRNRMRTAVVAAGHSIENDQGAWDRLAARMYWFQGDLTNSAMYAELQQRLVALDATIPGLDGHLFYLAIPPDLYAGTIEKLSQSGALPRTAEPSQRPWARIIIEKPFGRDLASARALNQVARSAMAEHQVYRIDHYLGKETVQNLLVLRFANSIFEPVWNRHHIQQVQITAAETVGVEHRAGYYERAGVVRDMFQNHLLQLLTLTAMEPPAAFRAEAVRDEKVKVLHAMRPFPVDELHTVAVRGQYGAGVIDGEAVPKYRDEPGVDPASGTPTYAAVKFHIDNWRWQGVPFFLRSGKRLPRRATEIAIQFRRPPHLMFRRTPDHHVEPNMLVLRIQPGEGVAMRFEVKAPGMDMRLASVNMDFDYAEGFGVTRHDAYETLLLDAMAGEATLFTRSDESEAAWELLDPLVARWESDKPRHFPNYSAGSWGPAPADELIARSGAVWREPGIAAAPPGGS